MEVPAPESGELQPQVSRGRGWDVLLCPRVPGQREGVGTRRSPGRRVKSRAGWGSRAAAAVGEGRGGRAAEGGGAARCPSAGRPSGSRAWPGCSPAVVGLPCLPTPPPPTKIKPETSRRGWLSPLKRPLCGRRRAPSVEGLGIGRRGRGGEGGVALASARFPPSSSRPVMSARDPAEHTGRPGRARPWPAFGGGQNSPYPQGAHSPVGR